MSSKRTTQKDRQLIRDTYAQVQNIDLTAELTNWSRNTVHKYVQDLSCNDPRSCYNHRKVCQIDLSTKQIIQTFRDPVTVTKNVNISETLLNKALKGHTHSAIGFGWCYEDQLDVYMSSIGNKHYIKPSIHRQIDILLGLV
ncbi:hypothetical protein HZI73_26330 (plasmid) [Vallitalea pronyensis]|uniref:Uncharacterized protein n=1 Tax=Vallitalea pronyensis TaxID=1348613 RepID=A0A8J8SJU1_9FIRM|nr:hypothetical protein [Vallitalea pronyensis]QUI25933.1 hypothetical protein HZI73_26330 [Vallitalea pronyensis]